MGYFTKKYILIKKLYCKILETITLVCWFWHDQDQNNKNSSLTLLNHKLIDLLESRGELSATSTPSQEMLSVTGIIPSFG